MGFIAGKPVSWIMIAPSVTPKKQSIGSNNPAMRLYKFDTDTGQVSVPFEKKSPTTTTRVIITINNPTNKFYKCGTKCQAKDISYPLQCIQFKWDPVLLFFPFADSRSSSLTIRHTVLLKQLFKLFMTSRVSLYFHTAHVKYARSMQNFLRFHNAGAFEVFFSFAVRVFFCNHSPP